MSFTLPQNPEAEAGVLGAIFADETVMGEVSLMLAPEHFGFLKHQAIFEAMLKLYDTMEGISMVTVREVLNRTPEGKRVTNEDLAALADVTQFLPLMAVSHARIVREYADRRHLIRVGQDLIRRAGSGEEATKDLLTWAEREVYQLASVGGREQAVMDPKSFAGLIENYETAKGLPTGLDLFDQHTGGLAPGNLVVVAGRPGMGKTALAVQIAVHLACKKGVPILFCSHEQTAVEIGWRALTHLSPGQTHEDVRKRRWGQNAMEELSKSGFHITDISEPQIEQLKGLIRSYVRKWGVQVVFVDRIGKVRGVRRESRYLEVGDVARGLKAVAKEMDIPVFALCQLNRDVEKRASHKPRLADLRDSGAIEEEADAVAFLWTHEDRMTKLSIPMTLSLAKNRHGGLEDQGLLFRRPYLRLEATSATSGEER